MISSKNCQVDRVDLARICEVLKAPPAQPLKGPSLYLGQQTLLNSFLAKLSQGQASGSFILPTGAGKSVIAAEILRSLLPAFPSSQALILTAETTPLRNFSKTLQSWMPGHQVGELFGGVSKVDCPVVLATFKSLNNAIQRSEVDLSRCIVLIVDEAHLGLGPMSSALIQSLKKQIPLVIALTATDRYSEARTIEPLFGQPYAKLGYREAEAAGLIAPFSCLRVEVPIDLAGVAINSRDYVAGQLSRNLIKNKVAEFAAAVYLDQHPKGTRALFNCGSSALAAEVAKVMNQRQIPAQVISYSDSAQERQNKLILWESGECPVMAGVRLIGYSYHSFDLAAVHNISPTLSPVLEAQRSGRGLSKAGHGVQKEARIFDYVYRRNGSIAPQITFPEIVGGARVREWDGTGSYSSDSGSKLIQTNHGEVKLVISPEAVDAAIRAVEHPVPSGWLREAQLASATAVTRNALRSILAEHADVFHGFYKDVGSQADQMRYFHPRAIHLVEYATRIRHAQGIATPRLNYVIDSESSAAFGELALPRLEVVVPLGSNREDRQNKLGLELGRLQSELDQLLANSLIGAWLLATVSNSTTWIQDKKPGEKNELINRLKAFFADDKSIDNSLATFTNLSSILSGQNFNWRRVGVYLEQNFPQILHEQEKLFCTQELSQEVFIKQLKDILRKCPSLRLEIQEYVLPNIMRYARTLSAEFGLSVESTVTELLGLYWERLYGKQAKYTANLAFSCFELLRGQYLQTWPNKIEDINYSDADLEAITADLGVLGVERQELIDYIREILPEESADLILRYCGFIGADTDSIAKIALEIGQDYQLVRQKMNRGIKALRSTQNFKKLARLLGLADKSYWENFSVTKLAVTRQDALKILSILFNDIFDQDLLFHGLNSLSEERKTRHKKLLLTDLDLLDDFRLNYDSRREFLNKLAQQGIELPRELEYQVKDGVLLGLVVELNKIIELNDLKKYVFSMHEA